MADNIYNVDQVGNQRLDVTSTVLSSGVAQDVSFVSLLKKYWLPVGLALLVLWKLFRRT
jgi:hypothetical protein